MHSVLEEAMVAALPAGIALAAARRQAAAAAGGVGGETFILYRRPLGPGLYDAIIAACQRAGYSPKIGQEAPRMLATLSLVAAGLGVTLVPQSMRRLRVHGVVYRPLDSAAGLVAPLNLAYRRSETSPAARRFTALVRARLDHPDAAAKDCGSPVEGGRQRLLLQGLDIVDQVVDLGAGQREVGHRAVRMRQEGAQLVGVHMAGDRG